MAVLTPSNLGCSHLQDLRKEIPRMPFHRRFSRRIPVIFAADSKTVVIGLAADSGCGKSTFMRRLTTVFGGTAEAPKGGNPDSNTLISETTTVICLDDYHSLDRHGRKEKGLTALHPRSNNFDLMYQQVKSLKEGVAVKKPIYNHVTGLLDPPELIQPPNILIIEGLHPLFDPRVRDLLDFSIYLDISDDVKFAWKIKRDMAERGHSLESIKASSSSLSLSLSFVMAAQQSHDSFPSSSIPANFEVFLSFRGTDTRKNFTDHLYTALNQAGVRTFRDDEELEKGEPIEKSLPKAIQESKISIPVFSRNYASSKWCQDELVKIMECKEKIGQKVLPIFLDDASPSDVRKQTGSFAKAFEEHEMRFAKERVDKWREALRAAGKLSGYNSKEVANGDQEMLRASSLTLKKRNKLD